MNNPAITNMVISLGGMQRESETGLERTGERLTSLLVARKLPMSDPDFITYLRMAYVMSQTSALVIYYYITMKVCTCRPALSWSAILTGVGEK